MQKILLDKYEQKLLNEIENGEWKDMPLTKSELDSYSNSAKYTKSLQEKKQVTVRFNIGDLAAIKAKEIGIGYQNIIQALVHNYVNNKITLEL